MTKRGDKPYKNARVFESGELDARANFLQSILARAGVQAPKDTVEPPRRSLAGVLREREQVMAKRREAHRTERLARGLAPNAGSGDPERECLILDASFDKLPKMVVAGRRTSTFDQRNVKQAMARLPLGSSRFGGWPDLPREITWPMHQEKRLPFVAQLDLSKFPRAIHRLLPKDGHLFVFSLAGKGKSSPIASVLLHRGPADNLIRADQGVHDDICPDWTGQRVYRLIPVTAAAQSRFKKTPTRPDKSAGWFFGGIMDDDGPGEVADQQFKDGDDWINLLAVLSVGSMMWSDCGHLHLLIRKSALAALDFSKVVAAVRAVC
jgi:hypothetical protein